MRKIILYILSTCAMGLMFLGARIHFFDANYVTQAMHHVSAQVSACCVYPFLLAHNVLAQPMYIWWQRKQTMQKLEAMVVQLRNTCQTLQAENIALRAQHKYAQDVQEIAAFAKRYEQCAHIAQVLMKHLSEKTHYFLVDRGANHGIYQDMVAVYKNCLVGRVTEVYPWYCKVQLITDAQCKVGACSSQYRALGIHRGTNVDDTTLLQYVSHLDKVEIGDTVLSSGEGLVFPQGFALGTIQTCKPDGLYHNITIKPLISLQNLNYCALLAKGVDGVVGGLSQEGL